MNIIQEIKALWAVRKAGIEIYKEATTMDGVKPGWKTTEFWGKIAVQAMTLFAAVKGFLPPQYAALGTIGLEAIYNIGRTVVKAINDSKQVTAANTTTVAVTTTPTTFSMPQTVDKPVSTPIDVASQ